MDDTARWGAMDASRLARPDTGASPMPRIRPRGPVLMGDIHPQIAGKPLLLMLWDEWDARDDETS